MLIYVSGPYTAAHGRTEEDNIAHARAAAIRLWEGGHAVICPHLNTAMMHLDCKAGYDAHILGDLKMLARCDAIYMLENWDLSRGAGMEADYAAELKIPMYYESDTLCPPLHPTEVRCPQQVQAFEEAIGRMMRVHLKKNADYSPANILGTGELGVVVRMWDKVSRMMNLAGFRIVIKSSDFDAPREPNNEAISDSYEDLAVYGVIGKIVRAGKWGK